MKTKLISLILAFMFIAASLSAAVADSTANVLYVVGEVKVFGYSTNEIVKLTDVPKEATEAYLRQNAERSEVKLEDDIYVYWKINVMTRAHLSLGLSITEDLEYDGYTLPMTVTVGAESISGENSSLEVFRAVNEKDVSKVFVGSKLINITCPVTNDTPAGSYEGKITLTLEDIG
jgi:hypothetical protein